MSVSPQELKLRIQIVQLALKLFNSREHYYWGAPDSGKVAMSRDDFTPNSTQRHVFAASNDGLHFCAGRCDSDDVKKRAHFSGSAPVDAWMAVPDKVSFPRFYMDGDTVHPSASEFVWGESCMGKKHFDCGSFVRYCYRTVLGSTLVPPGIQMHDLAKGIWPSPGSGIGLGSADVLPADIVYSGKSHVGLATGKAAYLKSDSSAAGIIPDETVHAFYAKAGIVKTKLTGPDPAWTEVRRWQKWA